MENYQLSPEGSNHNYSSSTVWNLENKEDENTERKQSLYTYRNDSNLNLYYINTVMHSLWDPSSLSTKNTSLPIQTQRANIKRDKESQELAEESQKRMMWSNDFYEALRQTEIPSIPETPSTIADDPVDHSPTMENSRIPELDFFSNEILYYNDGVFQRPDIIMNPVIPQRPPFWNQDLFSDVDEEDSDVESVYSSISNAESKERSDLQCQTLKEYACPICYESPTSPVSTICGHIFCEKCVKRLFRLKMSKWKCPQCRRNLNPSDYHPIYLP